MGKNLSRILILTLIFAFLIFGIFMTSFYLTELNCLDISKSIITADATYVLNNIKSDFDENHEVLEDIASVVRDLGDRDTIDIKKLTEIIYRHDSIIKADHIHVLFADNTQVPADQNTIEKVPSLTFDEIVEKGDHIATVSRSTSVDGENVIRQFVPVIKNGKTIAMVYCVTFCSSFKNYFNLLDFRDSFIISLVERKNGLFIYNSSKYPSLALSDLPVTKGKNGQIQQMIMDEILAGKSGTATYMDYQFHEKIKVLYTPLDFSDWMVIMSINQKEFMNEFYAKQSWIGILFIVGIFIFLVYVLSVFLNVQNLEKKLEDRDELNKKVQTMEEESRSKSAFLYNMSHDIRTPLNAIIGFSRIAKDNIKNSTKVEDSLNRISIASDMLSDIMNNVLAVSSIDSGNFYLDEAPLNVNKLVENVSILVQAQADEKNIKFTSEVKNILDENLYVDGMRLRQLLMNLISNAINLTRADGIVSLKVEQITASSEDHAYYKFTVSDNGCGIRNELIEKLLDQESEKIITREDEREIGVNLITTKRLLDKMDGTMTIVSKIGSGTISSFQLPIKILPESQLYNVFTQEDELFHLAGRRILVVEDNEMNRDIAKYILEENKIMVEEAPSGDVAIKMVNEAEDDYYDAILLDLHMPYLDGFGTAKEIRSLNDTEKACIPIVAMASSTFTDERKKAGQIGMNGFVMKPLKVREVLTALQNVIIN